MINLPIEIGDLVLGGRFKNKKIIVKEIGYDEYGLPTVNGRGILKIRIPKLYQKQEKKEMKEQLIRLVRRVIREEFRKENSNLEYIIILNDRLADMIDRNRDFDTITKNGKTIYVFSADDMEDVEDYLQAFDDGRDYEYVDPQGNPLW